MRHSGPEAGGCRVCSVHHWQEFPVSEAKPAVVTIYDYYNTEDRWVRGCTSLTSTSTRATAAYSQG